MNTKELDKKYVASTYARFPVEIVKGKGSLLWDENGKEYIDLGTGIAVNIFGQCDEEWKSAVIEQLNKFQHTSNLYYSGPCAQLAEMICSRTGLKKVFFCNSGAEANEAAIKAARKYAAEKKGTDYYTIITLENSFHGRTIAALSATGQESFHQDFKPMLDGFVHAQAGNIEQLEQLVDNNKVAAIMFEAVQGEGGVLPLSKEYVKKIAEIAQRGDILMVADEVQCGNGRTGKLYGYMNFDITPDIVSTAKGLGGGLPIGATILGEKVADVYTPGSNGSTFGGNPVCCAGALNILKRLDDKLLSEVGQKSEYIVNQLKDCPGIKSITGMGLMLGVETVGDSSEILDKCMEKGVLMIKAKNKLRLVPALNIPWPLLEKAISILKEVCAQ